MILLKPCWKNSTQSRWMRQMPTGSSWRCHIRCGFKVCGVGSPCKIWWFSVKQWPNYSTLWPAVPVLRSVQYLVAFCSQPEAASDVLSVTAVEDGCTDVLVKIYDSRLNCSRDIRTAHFVMDDERWRTDPVVIDRKPWCCVYHKNVVCFKEQLDKSE